MEAEAVERAIKASNADMMDIVNIMIIMEEVERRRLWTTSSSRRCTPPWP
jgi:hypothetical protein